jgi:hypothetical protein
MPMTAYLISLALVGLVVIAVSEEFSWAPKSFSSSRGPDATTRQRISRQLLSALRRRIPPSILPRYRQTSMPDQSGEKASVAKPLVEIRSLARSHTRTAIRVLVGIMRCKDATPAARVSAANAILDRGWGKATQPLENSGDGALELIHRIERVIVHPEKNSS